MRCWLLLVLWVPPAFARYHDVHSGPFLNLAQVTNDTHGSPSPAEHTQSYWRSQMLASLQERLALPLRTGTAKNVILFLGDGMSVPTIAAARIYLGQQFNLTGEEQKLSFEQFPYTGLAKTYCVNSQVPDSACTATAYLNGVKNNIATIGVTADVKFQDWKANQNTSYYTTSIAQWALDAGKGAGIVTTCRVTDASPVGTYAHIASRYWETDLDILMDAPNATGVQDITTQLVENTPGNKFRVIMGGGRQTFLPKEKVDGYGYNGTRGDGKDLTQEWQTSKDTAKVAGAYITNRDQLINLDISKTDYLLGLFHPSHFNYHLQANATLQPTLAEMTSVAIRMMQKEPNGYFLFIEGGLIDHGHHENKAHLALDEAVEFHKAIELAATMTSEEDTLIVVTADHAHTMSINGYPSRGSDILTTLQVTQNNLTYSTLSYANGPNTNGFYPNGTQRNIVDDDRGNPNYTFPAIYSLKSETHGGDDVAVFVRGPWAHLLVGNYEQTMIPIVMGYAAGIGPAADVKPNQSGSALHPHTLWVLLLTTAVVFKLSL